MIHGARGGHARDVLKRCLHWDVEGTEEVKELAASFDRMRASMVATLGGGLNAKGVDDDL
jgi:hypothetical protein